MMSAMSPLNIFELIVAVWVCLIAWLVRGRGNRWIKGLAVGILVALTAGWFIQSVQRAKHDAHLVELEKRAQELELNAMLREARSTR
jgi:hypothetical protein